MPTYTPSSLAALPYEFEGAASDAMIPSAQIQTRIALNRTKRGREITPPVSSEQKGSTSTIVPGPAGEADSTLEICMYTGPGTSAEQPRKKTRSCDGKVKSACFLCKVNKRKVRVLNLHPR
jgi:hypothetical protein